MEANGQNLGGAERSREEILLAEVRRLTQDNEDLLAGCKYGVNYLTEAFGADSSITIALRQVVEAKQAGAT